MTRRCTVCDHDLAHEMNVALVQRDSYRHIASHYGVSTAALQRHNREHIPQLLVEAKESLEMANAEDLAAEVRALTSRTKAILDKAEASGDLRTALAGVAQVRGNLELLARLVGELNDRPTFNLIVHPEWVHVRTVLVQALAPFTEARRAVSAALVEIEDGDDGSG